MNGYASGPGWIFPYKYETEGVLYAFFDSKGDLNRDNVVWIRPGFKSAVQGTLVNGSVLTNPREATISKMGDYRCLKVLQLELEKEERGTVKPPFKLPMKIRMIPGLGRIVVRSAKTLVFNRIAKTGSQSFIELLVQLERRNGIRPVIQLRQVEHLMEPPNMIGEFVGKIDETPDHAAYIRHYNFVDMEKYGAVWNPTYINVVRDPIDKVKFGQQKPSQS